jgi:type VI secretion system protein ImpF
VREPRPIPGAKAPLFDRLLDDSENVRQPVSPNRALDSTALREAVRGDLARLLNTRSHLRGTVRELAQGTVLDYGIPNITPITAASELERSKLARLIERVISTYEPRLRNIKVLIQEDKADPRKLLGVVYANLVMGNIVEPVYFPLALDPTGKKIAIDGSGTNA